MRPLLNARQLAERATRSAAVGPTSNTQVLSRNHRIKRPPVKGVNLPFTATTQKGNALVLGNDRRVYLIIQNQGSQTMFVGFGNSSAGIRLLPGDSYEVTDNCINSAIYAWTTTGTTDGVLIEGTL